MITITEQFSALGKAQADVISKLLAVSGEGAAKIAEFQLKTAKVALDETFRSARSLSTLKTVEDLTDWANSSVQPGLDKAASYTKGVWDLATRTQADIAKVVDEQFAELNKSVNDALDATLKSAPAGTAPAVKAIKSALGTANALYESTAKAARQLAAATEANIAAVAHQTHGNVKKAA